MNADEKSGYNKAIDDLEDMIDNRKRQLSMMVCDKCANEYIALKIKLNKLRMILAKGDDDEENNIIVNNLINN